MTQLAKLFTADNNVLMVFAACLHEQYATNSGLAVQLHNTLSFSLLNKAVLA